MNSLKDLDFELGTEEIEVKKTFTDAEVKALANTGSKKIKDIASEIKKLFVERDEVVDNILRAIVAREHALLLGKPGSGKTMLINEITRRIDNAIYFEWLFNKTTEPAEIFGPHSIVGLQQDRYYRFTAGKLPHAHIFYADEVYKANSPVLNSLLSACNERVFFNDGKKVKIPLITMFASSNELPES